MVGRFPPASAATAAERATTSGANAVWLTKVSFMVVLVSREMVGGERVEIPIRRKFRYFQFGKTCWHFIQSRGSPEIV